MLDKGGYQGTIGAAVSSSGRVYFSRFSWGGDGSPIIAWEYSSSGETYTPLNLTDAPYMIVAYDCTPDGTYAVGGRWIDVPTYRGKAVFFDFSANNGAGRYEDLPGEYNDYGAYSIAQRGSELVIAGYVYDITQTKPAIWRKLTPNTPASSPIVFVVGRGAGFLDLNGDGTMACGGGSGRGFYTRNTNDPNSIQFLPNLIGGGSSSAFQMSDDGDIIVGQSLNSANETVAVRWKWNGTQYVIEDLNEICREQLWSPRSDTNRNGSYLMVARAISRDGRYIAGWGYNAWSRMYEAFLIDMQHCTLPDVTGDGQVDDADLLEILFNFGASCNP